MRDVVVETSAQDLTRLIDPSLEFKEDLSVAFNRVFRVESPYGDAILKIPTSPDRYPETRCEHQAFMTLRGAMGVPTLYNLYNSPARSGYDESRPSALLRQYIPGARLDVPPDDPLVEMVWNLALELRHHGICLPQDFRPDQIVVWGQPYLVDLEMCPPVQGGYADNQYLVKKMESLKSQLRQKHPPQGPFRAVLVALGLGG